MASRLPGPPNGPARDSRIALGSVGRARSPLVFTAEVWEHEGPAAWHFVSLPVSLADEIEATYGHRAAGFGSLRVEVTIGNTRWSHPSSPTAGAGPTCCRKKQVRVAEELVAGSPAKVSLLVVDR